MQERICSSGCCGPDCWLRCSAARHRLTKLDGTAKGGIILPIKHELGIPVKYIGVGEGIDDLQPFSAKDFAESIFGDEEN